ncbi:hypothetical protein ACH4TV_01740 [Streptomyces sp. NPDC020898]|uniref:hypothetical protein n=1 Tax=Streptomyces sp. NPDC020898 TaxID=3365101 RepID=UPI003798933D
MNGGGVRPRLTGWMVATAVAAALVGVTGCQQAATKTDARPDAKGDPSPGVTEELQGMSAAGPRRSGGACVFVKPDGAQKFGHVGWGFRITGTERWVYGAIENPSGRLYTPPGGDIGAWHTEGSYKKMLSEMSRDALPHARTTSRGGTPIPGESEHPYSRYRCTNSSRSDVPAARDMIRVVEERGFLVGVDPKTGKLTSWDCLDATYDVLKAYRTRHLPKAAELSVPNVWVESLVGWTDDELTPH